MKIAIGSDHAGYKMKETVIAHLREKGIEVDAGDPMFAGTEQPVGP